MAHRDAEPVAVMSGPTVDFVNSLYMLLVSDIINNFYIHLTNASESPHWPVHVHLRCFVSPLIIFGQQKAKTVLFKQQISI
jgi:hypothetical protein